MSDLIEKVARALNAHLSNDEWSSMIAHAGCNQRTRRKAKAAIAALADNVTDEMVIACASAPRDPSAPKIDQMRAGIAAAITAALQDNTEEKKTS
jgi:hypothetical protein